MIFCIIRKKWFILTPEEWVRQHVIHFFYTNLSYPISAINAEVAIDIHGLNQRMDLIVYKKSVPWLLCEFKKPNIGLNQESIDQILRYNNLCKAPFLFLTNGNNHLIYKSNENKIKQLDFFPEF